MTLLEDRVAIVTGGGGGIGCATCVALAREGAAVVVADIVRERAEAVVEVVRAEGGAADAMDVDISSEPDVVRLIAAVRARFGGVHILDNNATVAAHHHQVPDRAVTEMAVETWDITMAVNLRGTMLMRKHTIPLMIAEGGGSIINISSGAAIAGDVRPMAYGVSKAGINAMTLYIASAYGSAGIRCNTIMPGPTATETFLELAPPERLELYRRHMLIQRIGRPEDIANGVVFLASDNAAMITGETIRVDGGILGVHTPYMADPAALENPVTDHFRG